MQPEIYKVSSIVGRPAATAAASKPEIPYSLVSWLALFLLGGGFLALYYAGIHYFPEFSWQDSLTY